MSGVGSFTQRRQDAKMVRDVERDGISLYKLGDATHREVGETRDGVFVERDGISLYILGEGERQELEQTRGVVFNVQRMSMHDGPGVRTNVFLKGCPLHCGWCANPESQELQPELMLRGGQCIDCGQFAEPCAACMPAWQATRRRSASQQEEIDARIHVCPTGALSWVGAWRTAGDVMAQVRRDRPFYGDGGGLTLTGGEPTMQPAFCAALLRLARDEGIATAMETCGHTQWEVLAQLLPLLDVLLFDVKHIDPAVHREHTGLDNALILANLRRVAQLPGPKVVVRVPVIPGFNADAASLAAIAAFVLELARPAASIDLLPYHTFGKAKYDALGRDYPWAEQPRLPAAEVRRLAAQVTEQVAPAGIAVRVGG